MPQLAKVMVLKCHFLKQPSLEHTEHTGFPGEGTWILPPGSLFVYYVGLGILPQCEHGGRAMK